MKKSLFLLPLLGGFVLSGCTITIGNKTFKLFEKDKQEETKKEEEGNEKGSGNGGQQSQSGSSVSGQLLATVNLKGFADAVDKNASPLVYSKNSYTVTIEEAEATTSLASAVEKSKTYEFRVYKGMNILFAGPQSFSKLLIKYSTWKENDGTTYYFDFDLDGVTNEHDDSKGEAVVTLNSAASSYSVENIVHQTRIASVAFYA